MDTRSPRSPRGRVVVGVDGSAGSRDALIWAAAAAAARDATLEVVSAFRDDIAWAGAYAVDPELIDQMRAEAESCGRDMVAEAFPAGTGETPVDVMAVPGAAAAALVEQALEADLLVVGSRGRSGLRSTLLGSVALHCATSARCPVVVVHPSRAGATAPVVVGYDDTPPSREALARALEEAHRLGAELEVVTVVVPADWWIDLEMTERDRLVQIREQAEKRAWAAVSDELAPRSWTPAPVVRVTAPEGWVTEVLTAKSAAARLLVVGSRSRSRLAGLLLGSVALHCIVHAACPVLVVHPSAADTVRRVPDPAEAAGG